ncbi:putative twin-arginine translocation pathway signal [Mycobacterium xenopi 3993]|nr:putative twin-arginine translocation pathway signal [Mycobacterium xenopi 3993]
MISSRCRKSSSCRDRRKNVDGRRDRYDRPESTARGSDGTGAVAASHPPGGGVAARQPGPGAGGIAGGGLGGNGGVVVLFPISARPATDAAAAKSAISAATDGTVAILSYSPDSLDRDFATAKSHLTGDFLSYYNQFTDQIVAPAAKQKSLKTSAVVVRAAVSEIHPDSAVVLVFVNQSTVSKDRPDPALTSSSVLVTLTKANGKWLISSFNPV